MILLKQMLILFFLMLLGFAMAKKGIIDEKVSKSLSWLIVNISNPALILSGSQGNSIERREILSTMILAFGIFFLLILLAEVIIPLFRFEKTDAGIYKVLLVFSNMGFMGFPIISAVYGAQALLYASVFLLPFNLLIYTYGIIRISGEKVDFRVAIKKFTNIGLISAVLALVLAVENIELPDMANQIITMLSNLTAPLCMIVIGASFTELNFKALLTDWKLWIFSIVRLISIPIIGVMLVRIFTSSDMLQGVCFITLAAPSASMAPMLARQYGGNYLAASRGVAVTTLLSVVTMPLLFYFFIS